MKLEAFNKFGFNVLFYLNRYLEEIYDQSNIQTFPHHFCIINFFHHSITLAIYQTQVWKKKPLIFYAHLNTRRNDDIMFQFALSC